jgi:uroporphyrinogen III methyltransferase/synthase
VLVTRPRHQAEEFTRELNALGATVVAVPTIEIRPLPAGEQVLKAIKALPSTELVVFTSANAVDIFFAMLLAVGQDARSLASTNVCAIGPETARRLEAQGVQARLVADEYTAEGLARALEGRSLQGVRVLVPRAKVARDALQNLLESRGAQVEVLPIYETICPAGAASELEKELTGNRVDVVTFTSSSTAANFAQALGRAGERLEGVRVACIGPVTADTARRVGMRVDIIAREYTTHGLAAAIVQAVTGRTPGASTPEESSRNGE